MSDAALASTCAACLAADIRSGASQIAALLPGMFGPVSGAAALWAGLSLRNRGHRRLMHQDALRRLFTFRQIITFSICIVV